MARLAHGGWPVNRSDRPSRRVDPEESRQPAAYRLRLESWRDDQYGTAALPRVVPILRERRRTELPALPAQRGYFSRRAVQRCELRVANSRGCAGDRAAREGFRPHVR